MHLPFEEEAKRSLRYHTGSQSKAAVENQDRDPEIADNIEERKQRGACLPYRESTPGRLGKTRNPDRLDHWDAYKGWLLGHFQCAWVVCELRVV